MVMSISINVPDKQLKLRYLKWVSDAIFCGGQSVN